MIYLDNAATSFPKPEEVYGAMDDFHRRHGVNPGRSGADATLAAGRTVDDTRRVLSTLFGNPARDPNRLVFTNNATDALNTALQGVCRPGDHVVSTRLEHNSVLRPLHEMARMGLIDFDLAPSDGAGFVDPDEIAALLRPDTRLVVMTHASNVLGTVQDVTAVGGLCRDHGATLLVDAAQTAGCLPIDMDAMGIDLLAFTGHKSLLGPVGTGGLAVGPGVEVRGSRWGGTGVRSALLTQPEEYPYRLEAGTLNTVGIAGLAAGLAWLREHGTEGTAARERRLAARLREGLTDLPGVSILGGGGDERHVPLFSVTLAGMSAEEIGQRLDVDHDVIVRTGLHCAPLVHQDMGTSTAGAVRFSFGPFNTDRHVDVVLEAMAGLAIETAARH